MSLKYFFSLFLIFFPGIKPVNSQEATYKVERVSFCSDRYDEYCPVYYKDGIVFCSNRSPNVVSKYAGSDDKGFFKIVFSDTIPGSGWKKAELFSKEITSILNDGPVTFNKAGDTIYFSRNIMIDGNERELSGKRNNLGLFSASLVENRWGNIASFKYNNEWYNKGYNLTTPSLSPDGKRLYFASDKEGGYGGLDLYYCQLKANGWAEPVNLGPVINTKGNESYPFINDSGELFFSSDGHQGLGGKDIFYSRYIDTAWLKPVELDRPINSEYDDFGFMTDDINNKGFFSSNRGESVDIYKFKTNIPQIFYCEPQWENQKCFSFSNVGTETVDTTLLEYRWKFDEGKEISGLNVLHCFDSIGTYPVELSIIDKETGCLFFKMLSFDFEVENVKQAYINSFDFVVEGEMVNFTGDGSYLADGEVLCYSWDFGDNFKATGKNVLHSYNKSGEYFVKLGLLLRSVNTSDVYMKGVSKRVMVFEDMQSKEDYIERHSGIVSGPSNFLNSKNSTISNLTALKSTEKYGVNVYRVDMFSSLADIKTTDRFFSLVPEYYPVRKDFDAASGMFTYYIDIRLSLMETYTTYSKMQSLGYHNIHVTKVFIDDPAEREIVEIMMGYKTTIEECYDAENRITPDGYILIDKILKVMKNYPTLKLGIVVHPENYKSSGSEFRSRSQALLNGLILRGVSSERVVAVNGQQDGLQDKNADRYREGEAKGIDLMILDR